MMMDYIPAVPVPVEPVDPPQLVDVGVHPYPDDYYAHPELDPLFADMFRAEGIPFPNSEPETPVVDADLYDQPFSIASPTPSIDLEDSVLSQSDATTSALEIVPSAYPVHTVPRDSLPPITPESSLIPTEYPSHLLEVHLIYEPPPPDDEGTSSSRPSGISRSYRCEPERVESVGTCKVQYFPVSQMPFVTDSYILHPEWKVISHDNNPHAPKPPEPHYEEEEIEPLRFATLRNATPSWEEEVGASGSGAGMDDAQSDEPGPSGSI